MRLGARFHRRGTSLLAAILGLAVAGRFAERPSLPAADPAPPTFAKDIQPLLVHHCVKCHGAEKPKGRVNLAAITDDKLAQRRARLWRKVLAQLESAEMPPAEEPQLAPGQRALLLSWLKEAVNDVDRANPGPAVVRRLNRAEYNRTIRDLVGIDFDSASAVGMPDDAVGRGFDNLAAALHLSPALMDKYFNAADQVLERVLGPADGSTASKPDPASAKKAEQARAAIIFVQPGDDLPRRAAARKIIERFARKAYRRPLQDAEVERFLKLFDTAERKGDRFENGVRLMLKAALVSPHFLFRIEEDRAPAGSAQSYPVGDYELATRLSYFLWSSLPDDRLRELAEQKKLSDTAVLEQQVQRMLADPKARALTENFATQWLQLRKLVEARPSVEFFPTFTPQLRQAMYEETATFFDKLREENKSILHLLDADYSYLNQELAAHYNIAGIDGPHMRRVDLKAEDHRGGLLGMAGILSLTSHTSRTSPTLRGKWVLEVIFGTPPPPPPPDAGVLKEENDKTKVAKSFRDLLAAHARQPACAGCHQKLDPLGFALDNYDAIGRWRDSTETQPLDTAGRLPTGEQFNGPHALKQLLRRRQDAFVRNLTEQLLTYALGRELQSCDEGTIRDAMAALKGNDYRFATLVREIVMSYPFRHRRNLDALGDNSE